METNYVARIDELQKRALSDLEKTTEFWRRYFGKDINVTWNETHPKDFHSENKEISEVIKQIVNEAKEHLNLNAKPNRIGEASLFIKEPYNDRLVLIHTTSEGLKNPKKSHSLIADINENYDQKRKYLFYPLNDRLTTNPKSDEARQLRGLTGWIATTGHYLLINGEHDSKSLNLINQIRPETSTKCEYYGTPIWGRRMSEAHSDPNNPKRYVGVPLKSITSSELTIGVLRYSCPFEGASLTVNDLAFLEEVSAILSAILNLESTKLKAYRGAELPHQRENLKRTGDLNKFLTFMSISLNSKIISTYLDIGKILNNNSNLRLVDAVGIDGNVSKHREELYDYPAEKGNPGLTWGLFKRESDYPVKHESVFDDTNWNGLNTEIFYRSALSKFGINEQNKNIKNTLTNYKIKIIGVPLKNSALKNIGVLKAEFPNDFDDSNQYDHDDVEFFEQCALEVAKYLENISLTLTGSYLKNNSGNGSECLFISLKEILRTNLIKENEATFFWTQLDKLPRNVKRELKTHGLQAFTNSTAEFKRDLAESIMKAIRIIPSKVVEEFIKSIFSAILN
jgi:hypothetical protein